MDQLYRICHISKRKAKWLLENGYIPCKDTGRKTRRFTIQTKDVVSYLTLLETKPEELPPMPAGIFSSNAKHQAKTNPYLDIDSKKFAAFLHNEWQATPDAISVKEASRLIGYACSTIGKGQLKAILYHCSYLIPNTINAHPAASYTVKLDSKIQKDPLSRAKGLTILGKTGVTHIFDRESEDDVPVRQFQTTLDRMKEAQNIGKSITYRLGYCNFTFELWMILHKADCNGVLTDRRKYLAPLNQAYGEHFESLDEYKRENNFKRLLRSLTLEQVQQAMQRAKSIEAHNEAAGYVLHQYKGIGTIKKIRRFLYGKA